MCNKLANIVLVTSLLSICVMPAFAWHRDGLFDEAKNAYDNNKSFVVPAAGSLEVAFSPNEGSEHLVIKAIESAHQEINVLAYSFTSAPITKALIDARHRGIIVNMVVDEKSNINEDRSGKARAALSTLATAGANVQVISVYPIHHDKVMIIDRQTVELGSFNYSAAAAHKNSENVLVNWNNHQLAQVYLKHFMRNWNQSSTYRPGF